MAAAAPAGYALAGAAAAVGGAFLTSIATASDFEAQINGIRAVMSPAEVNEFGGAIRDLALALGKDTVFSSSQAANAIEEMIKAGVPIEAVLGGGARSALDLASATGTDVTLAAGLAATAMLTFHRNAEDLPGIMDAISNTSNGTKASVDGLRLGLSDVGSVANQFGLTFEDTALALGVFANNGLTANTAGTAMKTMLIGLTPDTEKQKAAFRELGLTTDETANAFFDANGKIKSMTEVSEILHNAIANLTPVQQASTLQLLFGTQGMQAAAIAASEGAAGFDKAAASIDKMGGTAVAAAQRNSGLTGSMSQLSGSFEAIQITIGTLFLPVLTQVVDWVTRLFNAFLTLDPGIQAAIVAVVGIAGAAAGLLAGFILLGPVIGAVGAAFGIIATAAAAVALPIAALVAAGALLYAAWQTNFGGIRDVTEQVWQAIQPAFENIRAFIAAVANELGPAFQGGQSALAPFIDALSKILTPILAGIPPLVKLVGDAFNLLGPPLQSVFEIIRLLATGDFRGGIFGLDQNSGLVQFFLTLRDAFVLFYDAVLKILQGDFSGAWNSLWSSFTTILGAVATALPQLFGTIMSAIGTFLQALPGWVAQNVPGIWQALLDEFGRLPGQLQPVWNAFTGWLGSVLAGVPGFIASSVGNLWGGLRTAFEAIVPQLAPAWQGFADWLAGVAGGTPQFIADKAGDLWGKLKEAFQGAIDALSPAWQGFANWLAGVAGGIPQFIADSAGGIWDILKTLFEGAEEKLTPAWQSFADWLAGVAGGIPQFIADSAGGIWDILKTLFEGAQEKLTPAWNAFAGWLAAVAGGIPQFIADNAGGVWDILKTVFEGAQEKLTPAWNAFAGWLGAVAGGIPQFIADNAGNIWSGLTTAFEGFAEKLQPAWDKFAGWLKGVVSGIPQFIADNIGNVWGALVTALQNFPGGLAGGTTTGGGTTGGGGTPAPGPVGTGSGTVNGPLVSIGTLNVGTVAEQDAFLQQMADAIYAAVQRASVPPASPFPIG